MWLSQARFTEAAADAAQVPTNSVHNAILPISNQITLVYETNEKIAKPRARTSPSWMLRSRDS